jgi:signal transduction histidine kinase
MFRSATFKLTAWYLMILIAISLLFSVVIYSISSSEIRTGIIYLDQNMRAGIGLNRAEYDTLRDTQVHEAETKLLSSLVITNISIWIAGGIGSYYLARRTLRPIEEAHEAQSRFTSDASHELRTPLANMKTELEVALRDPSLDASELRDLLGSTLEEVDTLTRLSQTLLQLSHLDHAGITHEKVSLHAVATSVMERFDKTGARRVRLEGKKSYFVSASAANIEELLTILLDNALKYSPESSRVTIRLLRRQQMTGFAITNTGSGIASYALPHIFDRFYRADSSRTTGEQKSYGLGLSLAKKIVELHGGDLTVSSGINQLTTFRVLLPTYHKNN